MAAAAEEFLFAVAGALVLVSLAAGLAKRASGLGNAEADFMGALFLVSVALLGALIATLRAWEPASHVLVAATAGGAMLAVAEASLHAAGVRARSLLGERGLRWGLLTAAVALSAFGWGAAAVGGGGPEEPGPAAWVAVAVSLSAAVAMGATGLASFRLRARAVVKVQLVAGAAGLSAGMFTVALGSVAVGSAAAMVGAAFVYSAARGPKRGSTPEAPPASEEPAPPRARPRGDAGVKVRVPKGSANRVTRFRDDGLPPGGRP